MLRGAPTICGTGTSTSPVIEKLSSIRCTLNFECKPVVLWVFLHGHGDVHINHNLGVHSYAPFFQLRDHRYVQGFLRFVCHRGLPLQRHW